MTPTEITRIRALAEKCPTSATDPIADDWYLWTDIYRSASICSQTDAEFIAALAPTTVKQLCEAALRGLAEKASELLPCPFCDSPPSSWEHVSRGTLVTCFKEGCPAHGNTVSPRVWNYRAFYPEPEPAQVADATDQISKFVEFCANINHAYTFTEWPTFYKLRNAALEAAAHARLSAGAILVKANAELRARLAACENRKPDGYAYRYHSNLGDNRTVILFNSGENVNGGKPIEAIPYFYAATPTAHPDVPGGAG